ncbi:conserved membrane hypothetical protein [Candidatus Zixiibacteriota bacterium]|nr:conserved membrane hypothetical protein [candidate division Zixibacteria bacterium]
MSTEYILELYKQLGHEQNKYVYFMLAAAASAMGFAIQKTTGMRVAWALVPIGIAIVLWSISFYYGSLNRIATNAVLHANLDLLKLYGKVHERQPPTTQTTEIAIKSTEEKLSIENEKAARYGIRQFRFLIAGGIAFLIWHIIEMIRVS